MALRALMLGKKIEEKRSELAKLQEKFAELEKREKELEAAIGEATTEEEVKTVEEEIEKFDGEKKEAEEEKETLEQEITDLEQELEQSRAAAPKTTKREVEVKPRTMEGEMKMIKRGFFKGMSIEERGEMLKREEVQGFLTRLREMKGEKRAVSGADLTIPEVLLEMMRDNLDRYSKLINLVQLRKVKGKARQNIAGTIPEGIWMEALDSLSELEISFNQIEVDGYKVGGYIPIHNAILEDSDENLASEIMDNISQAIGIAVDKAILYGTGKKMPIGIVTRLAQKAQPDNWGANAPTWTDLSTTNILALNIMSLTDAKFFSALILGLGVAKENYSNGTKAWCMNSKTKQKLMAKAVTFNAAGAITAQLNDEMPVVGGKIITLDFIPEDQIIGGYVSLYLLAERHGGQFEESRHVKFIEDMTVYKGTARYDGKPVIGEGFVAVSLTENEVTTTVNFAGVA